MSILADSEIRRRFQYGLIIKPTPEIIQPNSVDLHLDRQIIIPKGGHLIDPLFGLGTTDIPHFFTEHHLEPGGFVLVNTLEWVEIPPSLVGVLYGKSSLARFGLQVECAGYVEAGWKGRLTLELKNLGVDILVLRPEMPICQISFMDVSGPVVQLYGDPALGSHYQGSDGVRSGVLDARPQTAWAPS